jgi:hypothetical protein
MMNSTVSFTGLKVYFFSLVKINSLIPWRSYDSRDMLQDLLPALSRHCRKTDQLLFS